ASLHLYCAKECNQITRGPRAKCCITEASPTYEMYSPTKREKMFTFSPQQFIGIFVDAPRLPSASWACTFTFGGNTGNPFKLLIFKALALARTATRCRIYIVLMPNRLSPIPQFWVTPREAMRGSETVSLSAENQP